MVNPLKPAIGRPPLGHAPRSQRRAPKKVYEKIGSCSFRGYLRWHGRVSLTV